MGCRNQFGCQWEWNWTENLPPAEAENVAGLKELLLGIEPDSDTEDRWYWLPDSTNGFTVKSCYTWMCLLLADSNAQMESLVVEACRKLWKNDVPSKV